MRSFLASVLLSIPSTESAFCAFQAVKPAFASSRRSSSCRMTKLQSTPRQTDAGIVMPFAGGEGPELPPIPSTSKRLFLVRHGEVINPGGDRPVYYGAMDVPLSPLGEAEARAAAAYLRRYDLQHVAASPLSRAIYGANEVLSLQNSSGRGDLVVNDGFRELDRGDWCGLTLDEIGRDLMKRFDDCDDSVTPPNGESYSYLKERVLTARDELLDITDCGEASALVSHLQVTRAMISHALEVPTNGMSVLQVATASVTCIDFGPSGQQTVHFQSFKPEVGLEKSKDMAN